jgi:hypothetical protein
MNGAVKVLGEDTKILMVILTDTEIGEVVPYSRLSAAIAGDVQTKKKGYLWRARRHLERKGIVFGAVLDEGLKRLNDHEKITAASNQISRSRRAADRGRIKLSIMDNWYGLTVYDQKRHNETLAVLGILTELAKKKNQRKFSRILEGAKVERIDPADNTNQLLELFTKG